MTSMHNNVLFYQKTVRKTADSLASLSLRTSVRKVDTLRLLMFGFVLLVSVIVAVAKETTKSQ